MDFLSLSLCMSDDCWLGDKHFCSDYSILNKKRKKKCADDVDLLLYIRSWKRKMLIVCKIIDLCVKPNPSSLDPLAIRKKLLYQSKQLLSHLSNWEVRVLLTDDKHIHKWKRHTLFSIVTQCVVERELSPKEINLFAFEKWELQSYRSLSPDRSN
jgi:hypothetical protein